MNLGVRKDNCISHDYLQNKYKKYWENKLFRINLNKINMESAINKRIIQFLKANNITISKAAEVLGSTQSTLSNKLNGRYRIDTDTIITLLTIYDDLSPDWLLLGQGPMLRRPQVFNNVSGDVGGDNIQGDGISVRKGDSRIVDVLQKQLEEEKRRSREYWNTIQTLINK